MQDLAQVNMTAQFIDDANERLFSLYFETTQEPKGSWLYIPPFGEEMNRCRSSVAEQAKKLCMAGYNVLLLDLFGTGESTGDFADASIDIWKQNIVVASQWLEEKTGSDIGLWGCRLGATLATLIANESEQQHTKLLLWQPVLTGKTFMTQYLRLRIAYLMARELPKEDTKGMREALKNGDTLEVAGYLLKSDLVSSIDQLKMSNLTQLNSQTIYWHERIVEPADDLSPASKKMIAKLVEQGVTVTAKEFNDSAIWSSYERVDSPELIANTLSLLETS